MSEVCVNSYVDDKIASTFRAVLGEKSLKVGVEEAMKLFINKYRGK